MFKPQMEKGSGLRIKVELTFLETLELLQLIDENPEVKKLPNVREKILSRLRYHKARVRDQASHTNCKRLLATYGE